MQEDRDLPFGDDPQAFKEIAEGLTTNSAFGVALREHLGPDLDAFFDQWRFLFGRCESPIETAFLEALYSQAPSWGLPIAYTAFHVAEVMAGLAAPPTAELYVFPQKELKFEKKRYRADFYLMLKDRFSPEVRRVVVECDGHDYHERTKQQAARDKQRDRCMTANGLTVFRFTGSEIHKDAAACADEVCRFLVRRNRG